MAYLRPCSAGVTSSWADHKYREPPSAEPGTDYGCGYGTHLAAADPGTISDINWGNGGGTGRYVTIDLDDGRVVRYLHLSEIFTDYGWRVDRGSVFAASGASGYGDDWYYGPHVHTTLWAHGGMAVNDTIDFELYAGESEEEDMDANQAWQLQALYNMSLVFSDQGSPQYSWAQAALNETRAGNDEIGAIRGGGILYPGAGYYAFEALANNQHAMVDQLNAIMAILEPSADPLRLEPPSGRLPELPPFQHPDPPVGRWPRLWRRLRRGTDLPGAPREAQRADDDEPAER